jgi:hypothetical protein
MVFKTVKAGNALFAIERFFLTFKLAGLRFWWESKN